MNHHKRAGGINPWVSRRSWSSLYSHQLGWENLVIHSAGYSEGINKVWHIHSMKYYSSIKEPSFDTYINMDYSQIIMLSIRKQTQKIGHIMYDPTYIKCFQNANYSIVTESSYCL